MQHSKKRQQGISLIEVLVVSSILIVFLGFTWAGVLNLNRGTTINSTLTSVVSDIKLQQLRAMTGDSNGSQNTTDFGIYFGTNYYVLFEGATYNSSAATNFRVNLDSDLQYSSITLPNSHVVFAKGSGDIVGFTQGSNAVTLQELQSGKQKIIQFNRYGVIKNVN